MSVRERLGGSPSHLDAPLQLSRASVVVEQSPSLGLDETKKRVRSTPVSLIIPPSVFLADERVFPFLGPLKVAAELERNGNPVEVLDLSGYGNYESIVEDYVRNSRTNHFGLTATTPQIPAAVRILRRIKEVRPDAVIILGGPHATLTYTGMLEDRKVRRSGRGTAAFRQLENLFDRVVVGDGEMAIFPAIDPQWRERVIDAGDLKSPFRISKAGLDAFSWPARHLIDRYSYHYKIDDKPAFSVIGQLGCPFECGFCGGRDSSVFRGIRNRTVENVVAEIEHEVLLSRENNHPLSAVMFYDDELNVTPGGLENLCRQLIEMQTRVGEQMAFRGFVKADLFKPEQAKLMKEAGFTILLTGVESGSDKILSAMKKRTSRKINSACVAYAHEAGLSVKSLMSIGHPGESQDTISDSIEWAMSNLINDGVIKDDIDWTIITQYPGSPYYDHSIYVPEQDAWLYTVKVGEEELKLWSREVDFAEHAEYYKGVPGEYQAFVWTDHLSAEQLVANRDEAEKVTRNALGLTSIQHVAAMQFEHSMGQGLPPTILRKAGDVYEAR